MMSNVSAVRANGRSDVENLFVMLGLPGVLVLVVVAGFFISRGDEEILFPKLKD